MRTQVRTVTLRIDVIVTVWLGNGRSGDRAAGRANQRCNRRKAKGHRACSSAWAATREGWNCAGRSPTRRDRSVADEEGLHPFEDAATFR